MLFLADLYNFGAQIAFFSVHMSLLVLRWKRPDMERPYRAPFNIPVGKNRSFPLTALVGAAATFGVWVLVVATKAEGRIIGFSWLALGLAMYLFYRKKQKLSPVARSKVEKIKIPEYKPLSIRHLLVPVRFSGGVNALQTACQLAQANKAELTIVSIIEIPPALPMDAVMSKVEYLAEAALNRAEAVAREMHLAPNLKLIRSRSIESALFRLLAQNEYDLIVIGAEHSELRRERGFGREAEKLLKSPPCRVLFLME
jgi:APA family basic amino acid/polyamine antiporter